MHNQALNLVYEFVPLCHVAVNVAPYFIMLLYCLLNEIVLRMVSACNVLSPQCDESGICFHTRCKMSGVWFLLRAKMMFTHHRLLSTNGMNNRYVHVPASPKLPRWNPFLCKSQPLAKFVGWKRGYSWLGFSWSGLKIGKKTQSYLPSGDHVWVKSSDKFATVEVLVTRAPVSVYNNTMW